MRSMLLVTSSSAMVLVSFSIDKLMALKALTLTLSPTSLSSLATRKEKFGIPSLVQFPPLTRSAERTLVGSIYVPLRRSMISSDLLMRRSTRCFGSTSWANSEKELLAFLFTTLRPRSGDKLILKELLSSQCGFIKIKSLKLSTLKLLVMMKTSWSILTKPCWSPKVRSSSKSFLSFCKLTRVPAPPLEERNSMTNTPRFPISSWRLEIS